MPIRVDSLPDAILADRLHATGVRWDLPALSIETLRAAPRGDTRALSALCPRPPEARYRYAPDDFHAPSSLIPRHRREILAGLECAINHDRPELALTFVEPILQLDVPIYTTVDRCAMPGISIPTVNAPVAAETIRQLGMAFAVVTESSKQRLADALRAIDASLARWYVIAPSRAAPRPSPDHFIDLHAYPGASVAWQCPQLGGTRTFHPSDAYVWESVEGELMATSIEDEPAPLLRAVVARGHIERSRCACGAQFILIYGD